MDISFIDNPGIKADENGYETVMIDVRKALKSFQLSFFAHEVMHKDGSLKNDEDLNDTQRDKRNTVLQNIAKKEPIPRPIAGIGIQDNFELGSGRDVFMALAIKGKSRIEVHIRKNQRHDLEQFIIQH